MLVVCRSALFSIASGPRESVRLSGLGEPMSMGLDAVAAVCRSISGGPTADVAGDAAAVAGGESPGELECRRAPIGGDEEAEPPEAVGEEES